MKLTDEFLDELASCLIPILDHASAIEFNEHENDGRHNKIRAEYHDVSSSDFWDDVASSTVARIRREP